jgi:hypothetical protein
MMTPMITKVNEFDFLISKAWTGPSKHLWAGATRLIPSVLDPMTSTLFTICMLILQTTTKPVFNYALFTVDSISKDILQPNKVFGG